MAIVRKFERVTLQRDSSHSEASCTYSIIQGDEGKSLQIVTYGSTYRKMRDKKSQSIRFSPEAIEQLRNILAKEF
jgi:hypothetical protein